MKEIKLTIPIIENQGLIQTDLIKGDLDSILIAPVGKCEIVIISELGYMIYINKEITNIIYIPIRTQPQDELAHRISFQAEKFKLNEKLLIKVNQFENLNQEQEVKLIIRYD